MFAMSHSRTTPSWPAVMNSLRPSAATTKNIICMYTWVYGRGRVDSRNSRWSITCLISHCHIIHSYHSHQQASHALVSSHTLHVDGHYWISLGCKDCDGIPTRGVVHEHATIHESTHDHVVDGVDAQAISHATVVPKVEQHLALHSKIDAWMDRWMVVVTVMCGWR